MVDRGLEVFEVRFSLTPSIVGWYWCIGDKACGPFETKEDALFERGVVLYGEAPEVLELQQERLWEEG